MGNSREVKVGDQFGHLTIIGFLPMRRMKSGTKRMFLCRCACGREREVQSSNLFNGNSKSCGKWDCVGSDNRRTNLQEPKEGTNRRMCLAAYKKGAINRNLLFTLTEAEFADITSQDCHYCGSKPSNIYFLKDKSGKARCGDPFIYNGIDRVNPNRGYSPSNCVPCCIICNRAKSDLTFDQFTQWVDRLIKKKENWK